MPKGLTIHVNPTEIYARSCSKYSFNVTVSANFSDEKMYTFFVQVEFENRTMNDWLRVLVSQYPIPGVSRLNPPRILCNGRITNSQRTKRDG